MVVHQDTRAVIARAFGLQPRLVERKGLAILRELADIYDQSVRRPTRMLPQSDEYARSSRQAR